MTSCSARMRIELYTRPELTLSYIVLYILSFGMGSLSCHRFGTGLAYRKIAEDFLKANQFDLVWLDSWHFHCEVTNGMFFKSFLCLSDFLRDLVEKKGILLRDHVCAIARPAQARCEEGCSKCKTCCEAAK